MFVREGCREPPHTTAVRGFSSQPTLKRKEHSKPNRLLCFLMLVWSRSEALQLLCQSMQPILINSQINP